MTQNSLIYLVMLILVNIMLI